jgi:hypothetical protein
MRRRQISQQSSAARDLNPAVLQDPVRHSLPAPGPTKRMGRPKGSKNKVKRG